MHRTIQRLETRVIDLDVMDCGVVARLRATKERDGRQHANPVEGSYGQCWSSSTSAVMAGEEVVIARAGEPVVRLAPIATAPRRVWGQEAGLVRMADDFDDPLPADIQESFEYPRIFPREP